MQNLQIIPAIVDQGVAAKGDCCRHTAPEWGVALGLALEHLAEAFRLARESERDPWEFAVEMGRLLALGATTNQLRWLSLQGCLEHGDEVTRPNDGRRRFERSANLAFSEATCFVLTEAGLKVADEQVMQVICVDNRGGGSLPDCLAGAPVAISVQTTLPRWDGDRRVLSFNGQVVKQYHIRAGNQEAVLAAFQEENWPYEIDDPLPPLPGLSPKRRLNETLKSLNANQNHVLLRFRGDGTGERICWEPRHDGLS